MSSPAQAPLAPRTSIEEPHRQSRVLYFAPPLLPLRMLQTARYMVCWLSKSNPLAHPLSRLPWLAKFRHYDIGTVRASGEQHALTDAKAHLAGLQIGHHDHLFADQVLRAIRLPNTGKNGALLAADIHPQAQQLVGTFHRFSVPHRGHAQVNLGKLVVGNLGC